MTRDSLHGTARLKQLVDDTVDLLLRMVPGKISKKQAQADVENCISNLDCCSVIIHDLEQAEREDSLFLSNFVRDDNGEDSENGEEDEENEY